MEKLTDKIKKSFVEEIELTGEHLKACYEIFKISKIGGLIAVPIYDLIITILIRTGGINEFGKSRKEMLNDWYYH